MRIDSGVVVAVVLGETARRPVRFRCIAPARAMERGDVLERDEDVAVQLDVRDVLDVAVSRQHAFLILAAEEGDLDLLALVLARVVLHSVSLTAANSGPGSAARRRWFSVPAGGRDAV